MSPSVTSSPVLSTFPDPKLAGRNSPAPTTTMRPAASRARQNSTQSNVENGKGRPSSASAPSKPNGSVPGTPDLAAPNNWPRPTNEQKVAKDSNRDTKMDAVKKDSEQTENISGTVAGGAKKDTLKTEEGERKTESAPVQTITITTVTKSGRASKPSTPALATFQEAARSRASRISENVASHKRAKKSTAAALAMASQLADEDGNSSVPGDDEDAEVEDPDEATFCYCNRVSFGEMIACDAEGCEKEWFHLECVGLKVAPKGNGKNFPGRTSQRRLADMIIQPSGFARIARSG
jgi:hypothetical protein